MKALGKKKSPRKRHILMDAQQHILALRELPEPLELRLEDGVIAQDDLPTLRKALIGKKPAQVAQE